MPYATAPSMPVNYWHHPASGWLEGSTIDEYADADTDGQLFVLGGYDEWIIRCPGCGRVYAPTDHQWQSIPK